MLKELYRKTEEEMKTALGALEKEFSTIRTGRATPAVLDTIVVDAYGSKVPIKQVASISIPDPKTIVIQPWDKSTISPIEKAILAANLGFTPTNDGRVVRIIIPALTEERRKEYVKLAKQMSESARVAIRNSRRKHKDEIKNLEKERQIGEDEMHKDIEKIQEMTDKYIAKVDSLLVEKENEIMKV